MCTMLMATALQFTPEGQISIGHFHIGSYNPQCLIWPYNASKEHETFLTDYSHPALVALQQLASASSLSPHTPCLSYCLPNWVLAALPITYSWVDGIWSRR